MSFIAIGEILISGTRFPRAKGGTRRVGYPPHRDRPQGEIVRRRATTAVTVAAGALLVLSGCGLVADEPDPVPLTIVWSDWSGWSEAQGSENSRDMQATKGKSVRLDDELEVTFTDIAEDSVEIRTSDHMSPKSEGGGIDLNSTQTEFTVERGETLEIVTPTMDAGTTYEFTITE